MILSLLVIAFCIGMAVLWAGYGLFSAILHLCVVLVAGTVAISVWEPITVGFLLGRMPHYAWAVGLLVPFAVLLIVFRVVLDKLVKGNVQFHPLVDQIAGGAVGLVSGVLTAGLTILGLSFMPLPLSWLGYQPFEVTANGTIASPLKGASLWIPADKVASDVFGTLSGGGFWSRRSLNTLVGSLHEQAGTFRLGRHYDPASSLVLSPETVSIDGMIVLDHPPVGLPADITDYLTGGAPSGAGSKLVAVNTTWRMADGTVTFDTDRILRLPPVQVRLLANNGAGGPFEDYLPIAFSKSSAADPQLKFYHANSNQRMASVLGVPEMQITWLYAIPANAVPGFLEARNVRMLLPETVDHTNEAYVYAIGTSADQTDSQDAGTLPQPTPSPAQGDRVSHDMIGYATHKVVTIEENANLPTSISANRAGGLRIANDKVQSGSDIVEKASRGTVREIEVSSSLRPIRLELTPQQSISGLGQARDAASNIQEIWLEDARGQKFFAFGSVLAFQDGRQQINIPGGGMIRNTSELPFNQLKQGDRLYVYFTVAPGVNIARYHVGQAYQPLNLTIRQ